MSSANGPATGLRGSWRAGRFRDGAHRDCNLHSSRAQFGKGAKRVFYKEFDAT
jgi:hypothetical protein